MMLHDQLQLLEEKFDTRLRIGFDLSFLQKEIKRVNLFQIPRIRNFQHIEILFLKTRDSLNFIPGISGSFLWDGNSHEKIHLNLYWSNIMRNFLVVKTSLNLSAFQEQHLVALENEQESLGKTLDGLMQKLGNVREKDDAIAMQIKFNSTMAASLSDIYGVPLGYVISTRQFSPIKSKIITCIDKKS